MGDIGLLPGVKISVGKWFRHLPTCQGINLGMVIIGGSLMALDCGSVRAYLENHTQVEAAAFFGVSDRTIRRVVTGARPAPTSPVPQLPSSPVRPARVFVPRSAADVAGPSAYWVDYRGSLVRVTPGTTGAAWNALQLPLVPSPDVQLVAGVPAVSTSPALESGSSSNVRPCPVVGGGAAPVAIHNGSVALLAPVKSYARAVPGRPDLLASFFAASVGPLPLFAVVLALLLMVVCRVL